MFNNRFRFLTYLLLLSTGLVNLNGTVNAQATIDSTYASQITDSLFVGQTDAKILQVVVSVSGNTSDSISVKNFTFNSKGTGNRNLIKSAKLHYLNSISSVNQALNNKNLIGNLSSPSATFTFTFTDSVYLKPGLHYFVLSYNISHLSSALDSFDAEFLRLVANQKTISAKSRSLVGNRSVSLVGDSIYCTNTRVYNGTYEIGPTHVQIAGLMSQYSDNSDFYTFSKKAFDVRKAEKLNISIKVGPYYSEAIHIWIDWDGDSYFESDEKIYTNLNVAPGQRANVEVTVPCRIEPGNKRMRVIGEFSTSAVSASCGSIDYGSVEDYVLTVLSEENPIASFISDSTAYAGGRAYLMNTSYSGAVNTVYEWDLNNDGVYDSVSTHMEFKVGTSSKETVVLKASVKSCNNVNTYTSTYKSDIQLKSIKAAPIAEFISSKNLAEINAQITLTDLSQNGVTDWEWSIVPSHSNGTPTHQFINNTDKNSRRLEVSFLHEGRYSVLLKVKNNRGQDQIAKLNYLVIQSNYNLCGLGTSNTDTLITNKGVITDNGGQENVYTNNLDCGVLIKPLCAEKVHLDLSFIDISKYIEAGNNGDFLKIYDGNSEKDSALHVGLGFKNGIYNTNSTPTNMGRVTANSGSLYLKFSSDESTVSDGFIAQYSITPKKVKAPNAQIFAPDTAYINSPVSISCNKNGKWIEKIWDFDGDKLPDAFGNDVQNKWASVGTYNIQLVMNACGTTDTATKTIVIIAPGAAPVAEFETAFTTISSSDTLFLQDVSNNGPTQFRWRFNRPSAINFVKGTHRKSRNPVITFDSLGLFSIGLWTKNGMGEDSTFKVNYIEVRNYCQPAVVSDLGNLGITEVKITDLNGKVLLSNRTKQFAGYTNYAGNKKLTAAKGESFIISVSRIDTTYAMQRAIWIDFNLDGEFDAKEKVLQENSTKNLTFTDTFNIDTASTLGLSRIRVGANTAGKTDYGCGPHISGEFEDYGLIISTDQTNPIIELIGKDTIGVEMCLPYAEPGFRAFDNIDGDITSEVDTIGSVNTRWPGFYTIKYIVKDHGNNKSTVERTVFVGLDSTAPEMILRGKPIDTIDVFSSYLDLGIDTIDYCSGVDSINTTNTLDTSKVGEYIIKYSAYDYDGNNDSISRIVRVVDRLAPVFTFNQRADTVKMEVLTQYIDTGWTVADNYDPNPIVEFEGVLSTNTLDTFYLQYFATDSSGNKSANHQRVIIINDKTAPIIKLPFDSMEIEVGRRLNLPEPLITDNYDVNPTLEMEGSFDKDILGSYEIRYIAKDFSNNISDTLKLIVDVVDKQAPKAFIIGPPLVNACRWGTYEELSVSVSDNYNDSVDLEIYISYINKNDIEVTMEEMLQSNGYYTVLYTVFDESANSRQIFRTVEVQECEPLGLPKAESLSSFIIYPNPAQKEQRIYVINASSQYAHLSIIKLDGKEVLVKETLKQGETRLIQNLEGGVYLVRLDGFAESIVQKLIILD